MTAPIAGTQGQGQANQLQPGALFGVPKYSTQRRFVPDNGNSSLGATPLAGSQVNVPTTRLDQLDIVTGEKLYVTYDATWTNTGTDLTVSPFFPSNLVQQITFKLQAAYNTYNQTGPLAGMIQAFRPMWGNKQVGTIKPNAFANQVTANHPTLGSAYVGVLDIDIPFAMRFDEYWDLNAQGDPARGAAVYNAIVTPMAMAAQARTVTPTVTLSPGLTGKDLLGGPVSYSGSTTTSTFTAASFSGGLYRDAYWAANSPLSNPPMYPWLYTRDFFTQPTAGQGTVGVLIQNTGVSVGQVLSLYGFVWDPAANSGSGAIVPFSSIASFEIVTGGSLQNYKATPQAVTDKMHRSYGWDLTTQPFPSGGFIFDFALCEDGGYLSNKDAINTYLVNGVQLNITFNSGSVPSSSSTVYLGVEALKLATS